MKKWLAVLLMVFFVAGISGAEEKVSVENPGAGEDKEAVEPQAPRRGRQGPRGDGPGRRFHMSKEKREQIKAHFEAMQQEAEAIRMETDPAKKAELTAALRAKLAEGADRRQAEFRKRVEKAEAAIAKMKARLEAGEQDKEKRIDEQLQKLLSGEKPERKGKGKGGPKEGPPSE